MKYKVLWIFLLLSIFLVTGCGKDEQAVDNCVYVKTQKVIYGNHDSEDSYAGTVKGRYESNLSFQVSGKILSRNVNVGDSVSAGDVLMSIDARDIQQNLNVFEAQVQSAKSQLDLAQTTLARYEKLYAASNPNAGANAGTGENAQQGPKTDENGNVYDADYKVEDENDKK